MIGSISRYLRRLSFGTSLVLVFYHSALAGGKVDYRPFVTQAWVEPKCSTKGTCDLLEFRLLNRQWRAEFPNPKGTVDYSYGDTAYAEYRTDSPENLENYVIVQFLRGCQYSTRQVGSSVEVSSQIVRDYFDETYLFHHPQWTIDSIDTDPVYNSSKLGSRHSYYRWTSDPSQFESKSETSFGKQRPLVGRLYVSDRPGTAFVSESGWAKNISLEFKTCLYKSVDVPVLGIGPEDPIANALHCFDWGSQWVYDHATSKYLNPSAMVDYCKGDPNTGAEVVRAPGGWRLVR